jgi:hypothetical protein
MGTIQSSLLTSDISVSTFKGENRDSTVLHVQFATAVLLENGHWIHAILSSSGHFASCLMRFLTNHPKPLHIRALAIPCNNAANFVNRDDAASLVHKLGPHINNGSSILYLVTMVGQTSTNGLCM